MNENYWLALVPALALGGCRLEYTSEDLEIAIDDGLTVAYGDCGSPGEMLSLVNNSRAQARQCGNQYYPPAPPVNWNGELAQAAQAHSDDMAWYDYLDHLSPDGTGLNSRLLEAGYAALYAGENLGGGYASPQATVAAWLSSPGHCANLMAGSFADIGAACAGRSGTQYGTYWTLVLAAPDPAPSPRTPG